MEGKDGVICFFVLVLAHPNIRLETCLNPFQLQHQLEHKKLHKSFRWQIFDNLQQFLDISLSRVQIV